jgi:hypothetical protein
MTRSVESLQTTLNSHAALDAQPKETLQTKQNTEETLQPKQRPQNQSVGNTANLARMLGMTSENLREAQAKAKAQAQEQAEVKETQQQQMNANNSAALTANTSNNSANAAGDTPASTPDANTSKTNRM